MPSVLVADSDEDDEDASFGGAAGSVRESNPASFAGAQSGSDTVFVRRSSSARGVAMARPEELDDAAEEQLRAAWVAKSKRPAQLPPQASTAAPSQSSCMPFLIFGKGSFAATLPGRTEWTTTLSACCTNSRPSDPASKIVAVHSSAAAACCCCGCGGCCGGHEAAAAADDDDDDGVAVAAGPPSRFFCTVGTTDSTDLAALAPAPVAFGADSDESASG
eukprot:COSAG06_NODE_9325_length_1929_cov_1.153552_3_plen_219_part_00